jgi:hypothetical protein
VIATVAAMMPFVEPLVLESLVVKPLVLQALMLELQALEMAVVEAVTMGVMKFHQRTAVVASMPSPPFSS